MGAKVSYLLMLEKYVTKQCYKAKDSDINTVFW